MEGVVLMYLDIPLLLILSVKGGMYLPFRGSWDIVPFLLLGGIQLDIEDLKQKHKKFSLLEEYL